MYEYHYGKGSLELRAWLHPVLLQCTSLSYGIWWIKQTVVGNQKYSGNGIAFCFASGFVILAQTAYISFWNYCYSTTTQRESCFSARESVIVLITWMLYIEFIVRVFNMNSAILKQIKRIIHTSKTKYSSVIMVSEYPSLC